MSDRDKLIKMARRAGTKSNTRNSRNNIGSSSSQSYNNMNIPMSQQIFGSMGNHMSQQIYGNIGNPMSQQIYGSMGYPMSQQIYGNMGNSMSHQPLQTDITVRLHNTFIDICNKIILDGGNNFYEILVEIISLCNLGEEIIIEGSFAKYIFDVAIDKEEQEPRPVGDIDIHIDTTNSIRNNNL